MNQHEFGQNSEVVAAAYLEKLGYRILEKNFRCKEGEIDLILQDKETIAFIEVKARRNLNFDHPKCAVTTKKQQTISRVALYYLNAHQQWNARIRFDVLTILEHPNHHYEFELIQNAFEFSNRS
ncbi:MAG: YraN family protein [Desulfobacterales bacterium]|nr:YraN family protein [Desulfobacterales bacterium]